MNATQEVLSDAAIRLDKLDAQAAAIKLSLLKMSVCVAVVGGERRQRAIDACVADNVLSAPPKAFEGEVGRVIEEVLRDTE